MLSADQLQAAMPRCDVASWLQPLNDACAEFEINTPKRLAMFLAQIGHESADLTQLVENLNYSAKRIVEVWPTRFSENRAIFCAHNPQELANAVYANRMGNGDASSGDGFKYRGRSPIMLTGRDNYRDTGVALGIDLLGNPDLAATPVIGSRIAARYFRRSGCIVPSDQGDIKRVTHIINGGENGLEDRQARYTRALAATGG